MSDSIASAVDALAGRIGALLTAPANPALAPQVQVLATRLRGAGIGNFVGMSSAPAKEIFVRRLEAQVVVRVFADTPAALSAAERQAATDLVGADSKALRGNGVLRVELAPSLDPVLTNADGIAAAAGRDIRFQVLFEHRPVPIAGNGIIDEVPQNIVIAPVDSFTHRVYASTFDTDPMADFTKVDGPAAGPAGRWVYRPTTREIRQASIRGDGGPGPDGTQQGTFLLLRDGAAGGPVADFSLAADLWSGGNGGLGLAFRFVDSANFGYLLLQQPEGFRMFGHHIAGIGAPFAEGGLDTSQGFTTNRWMRLGLLATGDKFTLTIDEEIVLTGGEPGLAASGSVGFFCCRNATARFGQLRLTRL